MLFFVGIPLFLLELTLGQFSSSGPTACWQFSLLFQGCGIAMCLVSALTSLYYNIVIAWSFFFFFASFTSEIPWSHCGQWSSAYCSENVIDVTKAECIANGGSPSKTTGLCKNPVNKSEYLQIWDRSIAKSLGNVVNFPAEEYFLRRVTGGGLGNDLSNIGPFRCEIILCDLIAWLLVAFCLSRGIKSSGQVVYFTATVPYLMLFILLVRALVLEGSLKGIIYFVTPDLGKLSDIRIWRDAASQNFFSLSLSFGGLITLASYNKFHNDVIRDSVLVSLGNCLTSVFAGLVIFSFLGFLSHSLQEEIHNVAATDASLVFGVYPFALTKLPGTAFWSIIFFGTVILLGIDSQFVLVETIITSITDIRPSLREKKYITVFVVCACLFILGLPMTCNGGVDVLYLLDTYVAGWNVLLIAVFECIAVCYFYGVTRFTKDLQVMVGDTFCQCIKFSKPLQIWLKICWAIFSPLICLGLIILSWIFYERVQKFPPWADIVGWAITLSTVLCIAVTGIINICLAEGTFLQFSVLISLVWNNKENNALFRRVSVEIYKTVEIPQKIKNVSSPSAWWGPAQIEHRILVRKYAPSLEVFPEVALPPMISSKTKEVIVLRPKEIDAIDDKSSATRSSRPSEETLIE